MAATAVAAGAAKPLKAHELGEAEGKKAPHHNLRLGFGDHNGQLTKKVGEESKRTFDAQVQKQEAAYEAWENKKEEAKFAKDSAAHKKAALKGKEPVEFIEEGEAPPKGSNPIDVMNAKVTNKWRKEAYKLGLASSPKMPKGTYERYSAYGSQPDVQAMTSLQKNLYLGEELQKTASKKKQSTMISGGKTPALVSMISDGKTPTNVVIAHIRENASIAELRAAHPLLFNGALSIRNHTASFLRKKISEGYVGYAAERERALAPTLPDKEKEELEMENNDIFTSRSKPKNKAVPIDDDDSDDENVELRVREEIEAFKRKTKARTARRRGFAVSTKLSIET